MVQTLGCGPTAGSPRSSSAPPFLGRGRVVPPPPEMEKICVDETCRKHHVLMSANGSLFTMGGVDEKKQILSSVEQLEEIEENGEKFNRSLSQERLK